MHVINYAFGTQALQPVKQRVFPLALLKRSILFPLFQGTVFQSSNPRRSLHMWRVEPISSSSDKKQRNRKASGPDSVSLASLKLCTDQLHADIQQITKGSEAAGNGALPLVICWISAWSWSVFPVSAAPVFAHDTKAICLMFSVVTQQP